MTLEEKIAQMQCVWQKKSEIQNGDTSFAADKAAMLYPGIPCLAARPTSAQRLEHAAEPAHLFVA